MTMDVADGIGGREGEHAGEELEEGDAQRIVVGAIVQVAVHATRLLGRDVGHRPFELVGGAQIEMLSSELGGEAEVDELELSRGGIEENVLWIDVLVNDVVRMDVAEGAHELAGDEEEPVEGQSSARQRGKPLAAEILEDHREPPAPALELEGLDHPFGAELVQDSIFELELTQLAYGGKFTGRRFDDDRSVVAKAPSAAHGGVPRVGDDFAELVSVQVHERFLEPIS